MAEFAGLRKLESFLAPPSSSHCPTVILPGGPEAFITVSPRRAT